jgi:trehalose 6-phosphate phosphatase
VLARLARAKTLCAFDFDGTLAPLVDHPDLATLPAETRSLLVRLLGLYPCVVLSGRSRVDLTHKLGDLPVKAAIGNHGAEPPGAANNGHDPRVQSWKARIEAQLRSIRGLWVEDKGRSLAVHYRMSRAHDVHGQVLKAAQGLEAARVYEGKKVVNIVLEGDPHKGTALTMERDRLQCDCVLYVGDDTNDEPAFEIGGDVVAVRIGRKRRSRASFYLKNQAEIDRLLGCLIHLREQNLALHG